MCPQELKMKKRRKEENVKCLVMLQLYSCLLSLSLFLFPGKVFIIMVIMVLPTAKPFYSELEHEYQSGELKFSTKPASIIVCLLSLSDLHK